ncbi:MAG: sodium/proline symporter [Gemmatimonadetes bacterium]|nr:sodium/proline symporter [Gemmatimonadota bacterium]
MPATPILVILIVYGLVLLAFGLWARRESATVAGYFVAGRKLPSWVIAFSTNATGESAWLLLGLTGMGYAVGVHAFWVVLGEVLGVALGWVFVALPFKEYADRYDAITIPDYLEARFRDTTNVFRWLGLIVIFTMVTAYTAAQLTATGKAFSAFVGTSYEAGVVIGAIIILYYTSVGGFKAVAYSDVLQGVLMFTGLLVLPIVGITAAGGWMPLMNQLRSLDPALLEPMGSFGFSLAGVLSAVSFAGIGLAFLGAPQLLTRFISAKDTGAIANGGLIAVVCIIVFDVGAVLSGMAGRALFPGLADPETIFPTMSAELFPAVFTGIFLVMVLAAIMSTVDSVLILASSAVVRDVVQKTLGSRASERRLTAYGKLMTVIIGIVALMFAFGEVRALFWFVLFAWSGLGAAFTPVVLAALFWKGTTRQGAIAGMVVGFLVTVIWVVAFKTDFYDLYEMIPGFIAGLGTIVVVSLMTGGKAVRRSGGR